MTPEEARDAVCHCICHSHPGVMHVKPCCMACPTCGRRIEDRCLEVHVAHCPGPEAERAGGERAAVPGDPDARSGL